MSVPKGICTSLGADRDHDDRDAGRAGDHAAGRRLCASCGKASANARSATNTTPNLDGCRSRDRVSTVTNARTIHVRHNSLGLRDDEFTLDAKPTIMFLGDSFVWGLDAEAGERFSELLKPRIPGYKILAAGVSGFGTDQEYLLLQRLWPKVRPAVVVLMFCTNNDRDDNSSNIRYEGYQKPYFTRGADGSLVLAGQPVPKSRLQAIKEDWWVRHSWLVRLANAVYLKLRHPAVRVPDPTERLDRQDQGVCRGQRRQVPRGPAIDRCRLGSCISRLRASPSSPLTARPPIPAQPVAALDAGGT